MDSSKDAAVGQVGELFERWVESRVLRGDAPAPEELCRAHPELLEPLRDCIRKYQRLGQMLDPPSGPKIGHSPLRSADGERALPDSEWLTEAMPEDLLAPGKVLGDRYRIGELLGRGGMGEVWRAFDLKLRVEVALKALLQELLRDDTRLKLLRREVRAAREVISPNVCRIFDLIEVNGKELVSMEYVDGGTLIQLLRERGPLDLNEALEIASQLLAGLDAIHAAGLVHRDVKPENVMITRAGRVVLMDFGLARQEAEGGASVSGTPAYMAPEQALGEAVDARADVYSAGVVLAEMVNPEGCKSVESRRSVWEGVRREPARLPNSPWAPVLKKAVAKEPTDRFGSASALTRALEEVTLRAKVAEDVTPYPGLVSFTERDAEFFFGREAEVERMWRSLERPRLMAVIGPSGAGKSSFLRAGLIPAKPAGSTIAICTPGNSPVVSLGQAVAPDLAGDAEAIGLMVRFEETDVAVEVISRWRQCHGQALLIVDQFEELFTQNAPESQASFAQLLGRLVLEADVHVLLAMRDDFLFHCQAHEALQPIFSELMPIGTPVGPALRRALVQPATKCGYRFEEDRLVEDMLAEVEGERGALPLLAFAMSRLWEKRDRASGLLTVQGLCDLGGVVGALAQHAEATLEAIGGERLGMVREVFRNLITAQGTRVARDVDELLSIFEDHEAARQVLEVLIEARLLTSFETQGKEGEAPVRRVEIIHESLLAAWPRLVRWQTQDADGAQLRDELRQAARLWEQHGRSRDRLWTGTAYREFRLWLERYPGRLSEIEEAFAAAMTEHAGRRRRRRRLAAVASFCALLVVLAVVASFWRQSVRQVRRAEASELLSLAQIELDGHPSAAVAYAAASLELDDSPRSRQLALQALWKGPTALVANEEPSIKVHFTPDGRWLVQAISAGATSQLRVLGADSSSELLEEVHQGARVLIEMDGESAHFASRPPFLSQPFQTMLWSAPERRKLAEFGYDLAVSRPIGPRLFSNQQRMLMVVLERGGISVDSLGFDGAVERLGTLDLDGPMEGRPRIGLDRRNGRWLGVAVGPDVFAVEIGAQGLSEPRNIGRADSAVRSIAVDPLGRFVATADPEGEISLWELSGAAPPKVLEGAAGQGPGPTGAPAGLYRLDFWDDDGSLLAAVRIVDGRLKVWVWSLAGDPPRLLRSFDLGGAEGITDLVFDSAGQWIAKFGPDLAVRLWSMVAPADAEPLVLRRGAVQVVQWPGFQPQGRWLATADQFGVALWPLAHPYPRVFRRHREDVFGLAFGPDGSWLASSSLDGTVRLWPLTGEVPPPGRVLLDRSVDQIRGLARSPGGDRLLAGSVDGQVGLLSLDEEPDRILPGFESMAWAGAFSPDGRLAAAVGGRFDPAERVIRVWDVASGEEVAVLGNGEALSVWSLYFTANDRILCASESGLRSWDLESGDSALLYRGFFPGFAVSADGGRLLLIEADEVADLFGHAVVLDLETGAAVRLVTHGDAVTTVALDPTGTIAVTGDNEGVIRVGPVSGEEPHLLLGHDGEVTSLAVDPGGHWIASGGSDATVRLWPRPDLDEAPFHTLPREELLAKLSALTNLRAVRDDIADSGWKLTVGPFPGWQAVPEW